MCIHINIHIHAYIQSIGINLRIWKLYYELYYNPNDFKRHYANFMLYRCTTRKIKKKATPRVSNSVLIVSPSAKSLLHPGIIDKPYGRK